MITAEELLSPQPTADPQGSAAIRRLYALLALGDFPTAPLEVTLYDLSRWKPLIERMAFERPADAEEAADLVIGIGNATGDELCAALGLWIAANVHFILDHAAEALRLFEQAEALYRRHDELLQVARLSVGKISALDKLGRYEETLACEQAVMPLLAASADPADQRRLAGVYNGIGISSEHLGRYLEALDGYARKLAWWQARQGPAAEVETARSLVNIGVVKTRLGL